VVVPLMNLNMALNAKQVIATIDRYATTNGSDISIDCSRDMSIPAKVRLVKNAITILVNHLVEVIYSTSFYCKCTRKEAVMQDEKQELKQEQKTGDEQKGKDILFRRWENRVMAIMIFANVIISSLLANPFGGRLSVYSSIIEFFGWFR